ncbi:MAG: ABC transporter permease subunit [Lentisphaerae bacterium]|nr:ABC transporter permease subunit [Lentisphaerota bacterium]
MRLQFRQFVTLATLTAVEATRQPIFLLLTTTCVLLTILTPMLALYNFGEDGRLARDSGLAYQFVFGLFVAAYAACSSLAREIRSGTASAVLSKPVNRDIFFLSKFAGVSFVIIAFSICSVTATLLSERVAERFMLTSKTVGYVTDWQTAGMLVASVFLSYLIAGLLNYKLKQPFESTAFGLLIVGVLAVFVISGFFNQLGDFDPFDFRVQWRILPVSILITMALLILAAIALALSSCLDTISTVIFCVAFFALGLLSDYLFGRYAGTFIAPTLAHMLLPNWQHFWMSDALRRGGSVPWSYLLSAAVYTVAYIIGVLCLGIASFRHADMK